METFINTPIFKLPRTSSTTIKKMILLGINTFEDLLHYFPTRYESYAIISPINKLQSGEKVTVTGVIREFKQKYIRPNMKVQEFIVDDGAGVLNVSFYNKTYLMNLFKKGTKASFAGLVECFGSRLSMKPEEYEIGLPFIHTGRIVPIYSETKGLSSRTIREKIGYVLDKIKKNDIIDILPESIRSYNYLLDLFGAYFCIHRPKSRDDIERGRKRFAFEELFIIQLVSSIVKDSWKKEETRATVFFDENKQKKLEEFILHLPFVLTASQTKSWNEIYNDLKKPYAMNRLLQGDVGSGKTVVAALSAYMMYLNKMKTLIMAPTEILARQHFFTIKMLFKKTSVKVGLLTSFNKKIEELKKADIIIGTHALVQNNVSFDRVGLVIVDEQHRFGVSQRAMLKEKGVNPHLLTMTATPIPRTVALTLYGELDFSVINEMPTGRIPIKSFFVPKAKRSNCYEWVKKEIRNNKSQVFIVCPFIEESKTETLKSIKAATVEYETIKKIFSDFSVGLLHGRMKSKEKNVVMSNFKKGIYDILVATPVVEVGIDISNATVMIVEGAERYGLAQLHQLRGRVGRGDKQSYCYLFTEREEYSIVTRLRFFAKTLSGQELAEYDFTHRGPGAIFGTQQHGFADLKIASLSDIDMISRTKNAVSYFMQHCLLGDYPKLNELISLRISKPISRD